MLTSKMTAFGLAAAVAGGLGLMAYLHRVKVGDTVEIPSTSVKTAAGAPLDAGAFDPSMHLAVKVTGVSGKTVTGQITGAVQNGAVQPLPIVPVPVTFDANAVLKKLS